MEIWLWISIGVLICIIAVLFIKLLLMKKDVNEIETAFRDRISSETNTLIGISHQDKSMRRLASQINIQLSKLRDERHRFQQGDKELKDAVTNISHDLRTPLTAICGYLQLLHDEKISDKAALYLEQIENRTESLKQLTEELFKYSVVTSTQESFREKTDVGRVLEECLVSFYGAMSQRNMNPEISITDIPVERFLDPNALNRIFSNIISNALKYSDGDFCVNMDVREPSHSQIQPQIWTQSLPADCLTDFIRCRQEEIPQALGFPLPSFSPREWEERSDPNIQIKDFI